MTDTTAAQIAHANSRALDEIHQLCTQSSTVKRDDILAIVDTANRKIIAICDAEIEAREAAPAPMLAILRDRHGDEHGRFTLADVDPLDCDHYAARFADLLGFELDFNADEVPDGSEDYSVTLTDDPHGVRSWKYENYMMLAD